MTYFDTNFFIYATQPDQEFYPQIKTILHNINLNHIQAVTSVETIQEIIHLARKQQQLRRGIKLAQLTANICTQLLELNTQVIGHYLELVTLLPSLDSRDYIHLATCKNYGINTLVTEDKKLQKIDLNEVKVLSITNFTELKNN